ncbi:caffeic acid 3-O-methyltransferase-like [Gossypium australe]|uniref:Caffeic acid 3-O-methyltransferase-like n=1 Tax=Gossypium australe TaxID=47621 RepID=A0A5B6WZ35_9ROSI|nr:caffeic acid 3-O-methyltransferase-like [Gossypium australe]
MICFSPNTPISQRTTTNAMLNMKVADNLDGYQGLPIPIGKKKYNAFKSVLNRTANWINSWSKRLLSSRGKEIFVKSILQSILTYVFLVFMAPKGVLEEIQSMICRVWWGGGENKRGWSMMAWDRLCLPKGMGSLGFRNLRLFNYGASFTIGTLFALRCSARNTSRMKMSFILKTLIDHPSRGRASPRQLAFYVRVSVGVLGTGGALTFGPTTGDSKACRGRPSNWKGV